VAIPNVIEDNDGTPVPVSKAGGPVAAGSDELLDIDVVAATTGEDNVVVPDAVADNGEDTINCRLAILIW